jgi:hypothetical protein
MRRHILIAAVTVAVLAVIYAVTFACLWLRSPSYTTYENGTQFRVVEYQFNSFSWRTRVLWIPALRFMEAVVGYRNVGERIGGKQSKILFARALTSPGIEK